ncbi:DUF177 domain-containing protein [Melia azedarach]|uniref:DUF177 domain-containing protein n=1 Tax=Melia azedarach TaxID=155640 RepID=A0ACC1XHW1_MELAZ|nr:DUF177 domain-containing protein [Melia azedarach]
MGEGIPFQLMSATATARRRNINPFLNLNLNLNLNQNQNKKLILSNYLKMKMKTFNKSSSNGYNDVVSVKNKKKMSSGNNKKEGKRGVITISTCDGRWNSNGGKWNTDFLVSLRDLRLQDLIEDHDHRDHHHMVSINLSIEQHASFGLSVDGRIITSFPRKCSTCSSPYCKKIDTSFKVWILLREREKGYRRNIIKLLPQPDIGADPSVMYVNRGSYEANLDSLVQDTIRLTATLQDSCSESCEKSQPTIQYIGAKNTASMDKRWGKLLELRNTLTQ